MVEFLPRGAQACKPTTQVSVLIIDLMDQRRETVAMTMMMTSKLAAFSRISIAP